MVRSVTEFVTYLGYSKEEPGPETLGVFKEDHILSLGGG